MEQVGTLLLVIGGVLSFAASIWYVIVAFQQSVGWGLAVFFLPFADVFFLFCHWQEAKRPFGMSIFSFLLLLGGVVLSPEFAARVAG
ncbi:hypothetical protein P3T73_03235 [Kiritimatiellota bacterium B12222]|nr:hypothetical protein P3T73_03235 [Kiritimatiellota bacterium B12222]